MTAFDSVIEEAMVQWLQGLGYQFVDVDGLLSSVLRGFRGGAVMTLPKTLDKGLERLSSTP